MAADISAAMTRTKTAMTVPTPHQAGVMIERRNEDRYGFAG
jgi:hypothetical protein